MLLGKSDVFRLKAILVLSVFFIHILLYIHVFIEYLSPKSKKKYIYIESFFYTVREVWIRVSHNSHINLDSNRTSGTLLQLICIVDRYRNSHTLLYYKHDENYQFDGVSRTLLQYKHNETLPI